MKLIKVGAVWCPSCLIMTSRINKILEQYKIELTNYDYDIDSETVEQYQIKDILPVLILLDDNNKEIDRLIGEQSAKKLEEFINR